MIAWAEGACSAVEREIADGQPGSAVSEWVATAFGPARVAPSFLADFFGR
jgi:hypothetical protein